MHYASEGHTRIVSRRLQTARKPLEVPGHSGSTPEYIPSDQQEMAKLDPEDLRPAGRFGQNELRRFLDVQSKKRTQSKSKHFSLIKPFVQRTPEEFIREFWSQQHHLNIQGTWHSRTPSRCNSRDSHLRTWKMDLRIAVLYRKNRAKPFWPKFQDLLQFRLTSMTGQISQF